MISKGGANMAKEQLSAALSEQMEYEKLKLKKSVFWQEKFDNVK